MKALDETDVLDLIENIYDAGACFERWPRTLERIADALGARDASLGTLAPQGLPWIFAPRTDPACLASYFEHYHAIDEVWHKVAEAGPGVALTDQMAVPRDRLKRSCFHNEWSVPQGYHTIMGATVLSDGGWHTVLMVPGRTDFEPEQLRLLRTLLPHLKRATQLNIRLAQAQASDAAASRLLEEMTAAAMVVGADGRLLFSNDAALALIGIAGGLRVENGLLTCADAADAEALGEIIASCAPGHVKGGGEVTLACRGAQLSLLAIPVHGTLPLLGPGQPAAILFDTGAGSSECLLARLRQRFGLTPAEASFAVEITKGDGKHAAAGRCGIGYATARTHLSRIFDKTGVRRQAELVRLILDAPSARSN